MLKRLRATSSNNTVEMYIPLFYEGKFICSIDVVSIIVLAPRLHFKSYDLLPKRGRSSYHNIWKFGHGDSFGVADHYPPKGLFLIFEKFR